MQNNNAIINSWNEWDQLEEVIVGDPTNCCIMNESIGYVEEQKKNKAEWIPGIKLKISIEKAQKQIDNLIQILKQYQVTIKRPDIIDYSQDIKTPDFKEGNQFGAACPRDVLITLGNQIIEAPMSFRPRFFEYRAYKTILKDYMKQDPNFRWVVAPKPQLCDSSFRADYPWNFENKRYEWHKSHNYSLSEFEPIFEAADITRFGKDIFVQEGMTTNKMGIEWLTRSLGNQFRVHTLHFPSDLVPIHMDATFVPVKPPSNERKGIILNPKSKKLEESEQQIFNQSWDIVECPKPNHEESTPLSFCSIYLSINSLLINQDTIIIEESEKNTIKYLESVGLKVIQCAFRDVYEFGGSFHCVTCDVRRRGHQQSYFPNLDQN